MDDANPELESFRQQWRAEVSARSKDDGSKSAQKTAAAQSSRSARRLPRPPPSSTGTTVVEHHVDEEDESDFPGDLDGHNDVLRESTDVGESFGRKIGSQEPQSALDHYEKAVEREDQGNLGDSLNLYRKAFKVGIP